MAWPTLIIRILPVFLNSRRRKTKNRKISAQVLWWMTIWKFSLTASKTKALTTLTTLVITKWKMKGNKPDQTISYDERTQATIRQSRKISWTRASIVTIDHKVALSSGTTHKLLGLQAAETQWWLELMVVRVPHPTISYQLFSRASIIPSKTHNASIFPV